MFNYDVMCMICGNNKVYEASFKDQLSEKDIAKRTSSGVCAKCAPSYKEALANKRKPGASPGPFFKLKD